MPRRLIAALIAASMLVFFSMVSTAQAQTTASTEIASNNPEPASNKSKAENVFSPEAMSEQIRSQQMELNELREHVKKLEAMLELMYVNKQAAVKAAVEPVGPPSPRPSPAPVGRTQAELLPGLGFIGAEVGVLVGGSQNPFDSNEGFFAGGFIDLPLKKVKGGKISYEIMIGAQRTVSTQQTTSGVIALVNSALNSALGTPPSPNNLLGPLPVTNRVKERLTVLTVVPASFKYTLTSLDRLNFRPYVVAGLGTYVGLSSQKLFEFDAAKFVPNNPALSSLLNALLNGAQVGGLTPIAPELTTRGVSAGQGDFRFGLNAGGGFEIRVSPRFSMGIDIRVNKIEGRNGTFATFAAKPTVHF